MKLQTGVEATFRSLLECARKKRILRKISLDVLRKKFNKRLQSGFEDRDRRTRRTTDQVDRK